MHAGRAGDCGWAIAFGKFCFFDKSDFFNRNLLSSPMGRGAGGEGWRLAAGGLLAIGNWQTMRLPGSSRRPHAHVWGVSATLEGHAQQALTTVIPSAGNPMRRALSDSYVKRRCGEILADRTDDRMGIRRYSCSTGEPVS